MAKKTIGLDDELHAYVVAHGATPDPVTAELVTETRAMFPELASLQIAPEQVPFMTLMTQIVGAQQAVEVGTFTGLSALAIARGLPPDGKLICCDISAEYTAVALRYWARAAVADRIDLRLRPALDTLRSMPSEPHLDLAFIDADKTGYPDYWAEIVPRIRPGGVILIDNVLRGGRIVQPPTNPDDATMAEFNDIVLADKRITSMIIPIADGVTLARKN
jgi:caffeoyl-CoA O-methyltransferase